MGPVFQIEEVFMGMRSLERDDYETDSCPTWPDIAWDLDPGCPALGNVLRNDLCRGQWSCVVRKTKGSLSVAIIDPSRFSCEFFAISDLATMAKFRVRC